MRRFLLQERGMLTRFIVAAHLARTDDTGRSLWELDMLRRANVATERELRKRQQLLEKLGLGGEIGRAVLAARGLA